MKKETLIVALLILGSSVYAQEESEIVKQATTKTVNAGEVMAKATKEKQTKVELSSQTFVDGVHTTFAVAFHGVSTNELENFWKRQLKDMCEDLETKKQLTAIGMRIPTVHNDTIRVLGKAVQPKKSLISTMHLTFVVDRVDVGAGSGEQEERRIKACQDFVYKRSVLFKRQLIEEELSNANKALNRLQKAQEALVKEKGRAEKSMGKNMDKGKLAEKAKAKAESELKSLATQVETKQQEVGVDPSEENTAALNSMLVDRGKATTLRDKSDKTIVAMDKKVKNLQFAIKKNIEDQANTKVEIEKATEKVKSITQKLAELN